MATCSARLECGRNPRARWISPSLTREPRSRLGYSAGFDLPAVARRFQAAAKIRSNIVVFCEESLAEPPPEQHPEVLRDHSALPLPIAGNAGIDSLAGDTLV